MTVRAAMARDGFATLGRLFPGPLVRKMARDVRRRHDSGELRARALVRDVAGRYAAVVPFEGPFLDPRFYGNARLHAALGSVLGRDYCIGSLETVIAEPGAYRQHLHIDGPIRFAPYRGDLSRLPPYAATLYVPLCDVTEENGPTALWAGSHKTALLPRPPGDAAIRRRFREVRMAGRLGEAFLFDYRIFHRGMPNHTREPRPILALVFTRSWYRDPNIAEVSHGVQIGARALAKVPERLRRLFMLAPAARRTVWR
ncbi:MAG: phytanoyl-CoA dioxygenase family protein [Elusimicrobia bacterium]|nr:phytanoyl-CoA dioxygenase family protein [Elusimicrobiota bacterium]